MMTQSLTCSARIALDEYDSDDIHLARFDDENDYDW